MKKMLLVLSLVLCAAVLSACQSGGGQQYQVLTGDQPKAQATQSVVQTAPTEEPALDFDDGSYDPASEEGLGLEDPELDNISLATNTPAPTVRSEYAGATPVILDPIDKPTPTVVPPLTFSYRVYDATKLGLSFEGPAGWVVNEDVENTYIIYNPDPAMDYAAALTITATKVNGNYGTGELKSEVQAMLNNIGASGFADFDKSNTAGRTLIGYDGVYANYTGVLAGGTQVAGRVHATCINKVLYTVHVTYPRAYTETYKEGVYDKLRDTIKVTK